MFNESTSADATYEADEQSYHWSGKERSKGAKKGNLINDIKKKIAVQQWPNKKIVTLQIM